jgi:hypothetical protein
MNEKTSSSKVNKDTPRKKRKKQKDSVQKLTADYRAYASYFLEGHGIIGSWEKAKEDGFFPNQKSTANAYPIFHRCKAYIRRLQDLAIAESNQSQIATIDEVMAVTTKILRNDTEATPNVLQAARLLQSHYSRFEKEKKQQTEDEERSKIFVMLPPQDESQ